VPCKNAETARRDTWDTIDPTTDIKLVVWKQFEKNM
jgi:hypothetical protein